MKKYAKTQIKLNKVMFVFVVAVFIYAAFGIELSDLSWETNSTTYKVMLGNIAILIGMGFDHWYEKRKHQQQ